MILESIEVLGFKNIEQAGLEFSSQVNCFVGANGSGKTNLLDGVYYLSITKSALGLTDGQCVRGDGEFFMLSGQYGEDKRRESVVCSYRRKGSTKIVKRNGKEYSRVGEHIGLIPIIFSSPSDTSLIQESADERRRFMNASLSQTEGGYLDLLVKYNHLLAQRNKVLKESGGMREYLEVVDMQIAQVGTMIFNTREKFVEQLAPRTQKLYELISGGKEQVEISYKSELRDTPFEVLLRENLQRDLIMGHTTKGIHRDDLKLVIEGMPIRKFGSQGQQKSMLLALKLAQAEIVWDTKGVKPILLLDDVFDKLDISRVTNLLSVVSQPLFGQIFITDCDKVRIDNILSKLDCNWRLFEVEAGVIKQKEL